MRHEFSEDPPALSPAARRQWPVRRPTAPRLQPLSALPPHRPRAPHRGPANAFMYETARHFAFRRVVVVAGYRAPRIAKEKGNPKSPHRKGLACDFRIDGVDNGELRDFVRSAFKRVGVGFYPNSGFVHLDVRQAGSYFWVDYSGPGQKAQYAKDAEEEIAAKARPEGAADGVEVSVPVGEGAPPSLEGAQPQGPVRPGASTPILPALIPLGP